MSTLNQPKPIINLEKLLESGDNIKKAKNTRDFVSRIWNRLVNANSSNYDARQKSVSVKTTYVLFEDFELFYDNEKIIYI